MSQESESNLRPDDIEEQFRHPEIAKINGQKMAIYDIQPEITKTETPLLVIPGWAVTPKTFKENILGLAAAGRRTLSFDAPHGIEEGQSQSGISEAEFRKVLAIISTIEHKNLDRVSAVGHSEDSIYLTWAAKLYPKKFRGLALVDPAGMIGKDSFGNLAKRFGADMLAQTVNLIKKGEFNPQVTQSLIDATKSLAQSLPKSYQEVRTMANTQIHETLRELKQQGIGIGIIHSVDDKVFPMDKVQKTITQGKPNEPYLAGQYQDMVDGFYSVSGTHNQIFLDPKAETLAIDHLLDGLEKKYK